MVGYTRPIARQAIATHSAERAQTITRRKGFLTDDVLANIKQLNVIAKRRGQTLAQMAIAWVLRDSSVTSALIGASKPQQILECVDALNAPAFTPAELDLWAGSSNT